MILCLVLNKIMYLCKIRNEYSYTMELKALIAECTAYDFKVMLEENKPKSWLKSVSAFANGLVAFSLELMEEEKQRMEAFGVQFV